MTQTSPSAVSARLRRAGFGIVATRNREGIRVSRGALPGFVNVTVDLDRPGEAARLTEAVAAELAGWEGYRVVGADGMFTVTKAAPAPQPTPGPTLHPAGTPVDVISGFDRSTKVAIHCPKHPESGTWHTKDPFASSWFPESMDAEGPCDCPTREFVTVREYTSLR